MKQPINEFKKMQLIAGLINEVEYNESLWGIDKLPLTEAKEANKKTLHIDQANPYEYRHGIAYELGCLGEYTDEALEKSKVKVLKNLAKDANYYTTLLNQKQSPYKFKSSETDKEGYQARPDGHMKKEAKKNEKANVKDNLGKKEEGSKKPKGIKIMPDKGVTGTQKTIKLKESLLNENEDYDIFMGGVLERLVDEKIITQKDIDRLNNDQYDELMDALHDEWQHFEDYEEIGQAISRSDLNIAARKVAEKIGKLKEHHNDPNFPGGTKIHAMLNKVADEWGKDSDVYSDLEDAIVGWSDRNGELSPKGILAIKALLSNWDMLEDYEEFLGENIEEGEKTQNRADEISSFAKLVKSKNYDDIFTKYESIINFPNEYNITAKEANQILKKYFDDNDWDKFEEYSNQDIDPAGGYGLDSHMEEGSFMGGVDLGSSFDKMKGDMSTEDEFNQLMNKYDWYYEMSDDPRSYDRGVTLDRQLRTLGKQMGANKAVDMFNAKAPSDRKITSSWFMEGINDHPSMGSITDNPQTNIKGTMADYDPKAAAGRLAKLKSFGPKPKSDDKHAKLKETLKAKLKELINPKDIQAAKSTGDVVNIPAQDTAAQTAAKNAKINFRTYK